MIRVLELFAGIVACSKALTNLSIEHEIVDAVEIDKYAIRSFNAIHGTNFEPQDIATWDKDVECDLIMHGSPCQDFSVAGKNAGGDEGSGTRSSLLYESLRIIKKIKPNIVIWENVKNLLSKKHRHNFDAYLDAMADLGYANNYKVLNAKDYGVPQNRERVFTVSIRKDVYKGFFFPAPIPLEKRLKDILEDEVDEKYYLSDAMLKYVLCPGTKTYHRTPTLDNDVARTITATVAKMHRAGIDNYVSNMQGGNRQPKIVNDIRIRRLTPRECWRLMSFSDEDFDKARAVGISDAQLYKQAGNSIVVTCLEAIIKGIEWSKNGA